MPVNRISFFMRLAIFMAGVVFIAFGVSFATKAMLGTSPISSIPYAMSLYFNSLSFGTWVAIFNLALLLIEIILLKFKIGPGNILIQLLLACFFGALVDISMWALSAFQPVAYVHKILSVILGCFLMALGATMDITTRISVLPGDGFAQAVAGLAGGDIGRVRLISDIVMSSIAFLICLILADNTQGVREGTAISAVLTGAFIMPLLKIAKKLNFFSP